MTERSSFDRAKWWLSNLRNKFAADIPDIDLVLVGNKSDMPAGQHVVTAEEGSSLAAEFATHFSIVSAKENLNVAALFSSLASRIVERLSHTPAADEPAADEPKPSQETRTLKPLPARTPKTGCCGARPS